MRVVSETSLHLGHAGDVRNLPALHAAGLKLVIDLAAEELPAVLSRDLVYCRFPMLDGDDNPDWLLRLAVESVASAVQSRTPCLIGCSAGLSRSPAIAAFGLARALSLRVEDALERVAAVGPVSIAPGLWKQLQQVCGSGEPSRCSFETQSMSRPISASSATPR